MENIIFDSILGILNEYKDCPLCKSKMTMHRGSSVSSISYNDQMLTIKDNDYTIKIDVYSSSIEIEQTFQLNDYNYAGYKYSQPKAHQLPANGILMVGIVLECGNVWCTKYSYTLCLDLDLTVCRFKRASLNAEWVCVEDGPDVFEIRNTHSMGITKYSHHFADGSTKSIEVPLIPINSSNPKETLERLKKLIIFT